MSLLKSIAKALARNAVRHGGNWVGLGPLGEVALQIYDDVWKAWDKEQKDEQRKRHDVEAVVQQLAPEIHVHIHQVVQEVAADQPVEVQQAIAAYLNQVPATIQRSLRRPSDRTGRSVPAYLALRQAEDLLPLLPPTPCATKPRC